MRGGFGSPNARQATICAHAQRNPLSAN